MSRAKPHDGAQGRCPSTARTSRNPPIANNVSPRIAVEEQGGISWIAAKRELLSFSSCIGNVAFQCCNVLAQLVACQQRSNPHAPTTSAIARGVRITVPCPQIGDAYDAWPPHWRGPPSKAVTAQIVRKYSNHLGVVNERWVSSR